MKHRRGRALRRRYGRAGYTSKPLVFPDVRSFGELFEGYAPWNSTLSRRSTPQAFPPVKVEGAKGSIGPYLVVSGGEHRSMAVKPNQAVIDYIVSNMFSILSDDTIYFEIVIRDENEALVTAKYNKIIGSRWLALIDPKTIPEVG